MLLTDNYNNMTKLDITSTFTNFWHATIQVTHKRRQLKTKPGIITTWLN